MNPCPLCFKPLENFLPLAPGDCLVCAECGVILTVTDSYAIVAATPEQITALPHTRFNVVMETSCRVLARLIHRRTPQKVANNFDSPQVREPTNQPKTPK